MTDATPLSPRLRDAPRARVRRLGRPAVAFCAWLVLLATLFAGWDSLGWPVRVVCPFRPQLLVAGAVLLAGALAARSGWATRLACAATVAVNLAVVWPWLVPAATAPAGATFRLMHWNTWARHPDPSRVIESVAASGADVALLCELPNALRGTRAPAIQGYQTWARDEYLIAVRDGSGVSLVSSRIAHPPNGLEARVRFDDREMRLLVVHSTRPTSKTGCWLQDHHMNAMRRWFDSSPLPTVITGDFNQTPWCPRLEQLIDELRLTDTSLGRGLTYTYPGDLPLLGRMVGVAIDHCLCTADLACRRRWVGPANGSNHRPVFVELGWRRP